jgi:hypothetical protein
MTKQIDMKIEELLKSAAESSNLLLTRVEAIKTIDDSVASEAIKIRTKLQIIHRYLQSESASEPKAIKSLTLLIDKDLEYLEADFASFLNAAAIHNKPKDAFARLFNRYQQTLLDIRRKISQE